MMVDEAKFWQRVDRRGENDCWLWTGALTGRGYGKLGKISATHISLTLDGRPRTNDLNALHSCDNPPCVNPAHLRWGTDAENMRDCLERGRHEKVAKTHCPRGHPYSGDNLYHGPGKQGRVCKTCRMHNRQRTRAIAAAKGLRG